MGTARSFGEQLESPGLELLTYRSNTTRAHFQALWRAQRFRPSFDSLLAGIDLWNGICSGLLADAPLMARLHALRPAVFVGDTVFLCTFRLGYALQVRCVRWTRLVMLPP